MDLKPFRPRETNSIVANGTSQRWVVKGQLLRLANPTETPIYVAMGAADVIATVANGMPILPMTAELITAPANMQAIAAITESASARLSITVGEGNV